MTDLFTPVPEPVDARGHVCPPDYPVETMRFHPRGRPVHEGVTVELARHTDGRWMWATKYSLKDGSGCSYRVGPKWGQFTADRQTALHEALRELTDDGRVPAAMVDALRAIDAGRVAV